MIWIKCDCSCFVGNRVEGGGGCVFITRKGVSVIPDKRMAWMIRDSGGGGVGVNGRRGG